MAPSRSLFLFVPILVLAGCSEARVGEQEACSLRAVEQVAVRDALANYVTAWLSNDPDSVMATLGSEIVLQPHHGGEPVIGADRVADWWFPQGPPTTISAFTVDTREVSGCGSLAYAWGRSSVEWTYEGTHYMNEGNALSILGKGTDGRWRIVHQIWNDPPAEVIG